MDYEELLKKAKKELPKTAETGSDRFEPVEPVIEKQGRTTLIKNFSDIAKNLRREKADIAKYLFKELGVKGAISGDMLLLNGSLDRPLIKKRLDDFTRDYVRCHECSKVDTKLVTDKKIATVKCEACGAKKSLKW